jgi:hypothetical protein
MDAKKSTAYALLKQDQQHARRIKELQGDLDQATQALEELRDSVAWSEEAYDLKEHLCEMAPANVSVEPLIEIRKTAHTAKIHTFRKAKGAIK